MKKIVTLPLFCLACFLFSLLMPHVAKAANIVWIGTTSSFNTGSNWVGGVVPGVADVAVFDPSQTSGTNASCSIDIAATTTIGGISMASGYTGTVTFAPGGAFILTVGTATGVGTAQFLGGTFDGGSAGRRLMIIANLTIQNNFSINTCDFRTFADVTINPGANIFNMGSSTWLAGAGLAGVASTNTISFVSCTSSNVTAGSGTFRPTVNTNVNSNLILTGNVTFNNLLFSSVVSTGLTATLTVNGTLTANGTTTFSGANLGTFLLTGSGSIASTGDIIMTGATPSPLWNINIPLSTQGNLTISSTFRASTSTCSITFTGTNAQTITNTSSGASWDIPTLVVNKTSGTATMASNAAIKQNLTITSGTLDTYTYTCNRTAGGGTLTVGASGTLLVGGASGGVGTSNYPSNFTRHSHSGTVNFNNNTGATVVIPLLTGVDRYNNLTCSNNSIRNLANYDTINGNLTVSGGTLDIQANLLQRGAVGGTLAVSAGAFLKCGGAFSGYNGTSNYPLNYATHTLDPTSTVEFYNAGVITIPSSVNLGAALPSVVFGNLTISSASAATKNLLNNTTVIGTLTIGANCTLDATASNYTITIGGNWVNSGTFTPRSGSVNFNGSSNAQTITGATTFSNLTFSNTFATAPQITLNNSINVNTTLAFSNAPKINLNNNSLTLGISAASAGTLTHTGLSSNGWMYGGNFTRWFATTLVTIPNAKGLFPMGTDVGTNDFCPLWTGSSANLTTGGTISCNYIYVAGTIAMNGGNGYADVSWGKNYYAVTNAHWDISTANGFAPAGNTVNIRYGGGANAFGVNVITDLASEENAAATIGSFAASTNNSVIYEVNRLDMLLSEFNNSGAGQVFRIGTTDTDQSALPVTWLTFDAVARNNHEVEITWSTATEKNNNYFAVLRSADGTNFDEVDRVYAKGNSLIEKNYATTDAIKSAGLWYYKIGQYDLNGASSFTAVRPVEIKNDPQIRFFPNPAYDELVLENISNGSAKTSILVIDATGKIVKEVKLESDLTRADIFISDLPAARYEVHIINAENGENLSRCSFIKL